MLPEKLEAGRIRTGRLASTADYGPYGCFEIQGPTGAKLSIMAAGGDDTGWEHVSVSTDRRCPNWVEMSFIKDLFWTEDECVIQYHPPRSQYVNNHPNCLHLWRPKLIELPLPPTELVGILGLETAS